MNNVRNIAAMANRAVRSAGVAVRGVLVLLPLPLLALRPYPGVGPAGLRPGQFEVIATP